MIWRLHGGVQIINAKVLEMANELVFSTEVECVRNFMLRIDMSRYEARQTLKSLVDFFTESRACDNSKSFYLRGTFVPYENDRAEWLATIPQSFRDDVAALVHAHSVVSRMNETLVKLAHDAELLYKQQKERAEAAEAELRKITSGECTAD